MHKMLLNEAVLDLSIRPNGPILIKAGETGGLDPTHPDMEFVRSVGQVFIPGASLKGVVRAHAERIVRTIQPGTRPAGGKGACDPLNRGESCGFRLEHERLDAAAKYKQSCAVCRLFGSTVVAGRVRFTDALPQTVGVAKEDVLLIEERNGVAIDRVYGSVAVGPFNYEVVTRGVFTTQIVFRNITLPQLALVGLALRDLGEGRVGLGFGKSRGMGRVTIGWGKLTLRYPLAQLKADQPPADALLGVGELLGDEPRASYGLVAGDRAPLPQGLRFVGDDWGALVAVAEGDRQVQEVFRAATARWQAEVRHV